MISTCKETKQLDICSHENEQMEGEKLGIWGLAPRKNFEAIPLECWKKPLCKIGHKLCSSFIFMLKEKLTLYLVCIENLITLDKIEKLLLNMCHIFACLKLLERGVATPLYPKMSATLPHMMLIIIIIVIIVIIFVFFFFFFFFIVLWHKDNLGYTKTLQQAGF